MAQDNGSSWHKWDFHVHTPYSILHNEYGFDPNIEDENNQKHFDEYVKYLFMKAIEKEIVAIGVTDYFSIDGYKRIRQDYLNNPEKMKALFPDETLRVKINQMFIFPNIEFRLSMFVGRDNNAVNYHVLFSDKVDVNTIEECFLERLKLPHEADSTLPLTRRSIETIGHEYKTNNPDEFRSDFFVGMEKITVNHEDIIDALTSNSLLANKYLISIPVDEDLSQIDWKSRDSYIRLILYQQSNLLMTSNLSTRNWALAKGHEKEQIAEFKSIKPCIWGSDAHSYERMFSPDADRFCWIKADPTFEGLQQILYEPEDRVRIQKNKPEEKDEHQIIDYLLFKDDRFQTNPVYFNEGLTSIIGGKSTGKSILIHHIAKGIDQKQVEEREKTVGTGQRLNVPVDVVWKDGVSGDRKIIYIPQSWLNRIVDESTGDSQLNTMLRDILLQQDEIGNADKILKKCVAEIIEQLKHDILHYISACKNANEYERQLHDSGRSDAFKSAIEKLEKKREELSTEAGITEEDLKKHLELEKKIAEHNRLLEAFKKEESFLLSLPEPFVYLFHLTNITADGTPHYDLNDFSMSKDWINATIRQMNETALQIWEPGIQSVIQRLTDERQKTQVTLERLQTEINPLQQLVSRSEELKKIDTLLQEENEKLQNAISLESQKEENETKADRIKKNILLTRQALQVAYEQFANTLLTNNSNESDLKFEATIQIKRNELFEAIYGLFDNRNLRPFKEKYHYNITDKDELVIDDGLFKALWEAMQDGTLSFKAGNTLQSALEHLFSDWFYVHYTVKSGEDTINSMSPGKKALVLLEMIVNLEKGKCPILIDQPEDDLDNRSIYTDLVAYLKTKKHERQIIVVTHNANVVIGADAEEVIIANQMGKESPNHKRRFEYRSGSIENTTPVYGGDGAILPGVLNQKGIQEQICDILEGGKDAFELRRKKYISSTSLI